MGGDNTLLGGTRAARDEPLHDDEPAHLPYAEDERRHRSEQLHALVEQAPIGIYLVDAWFRVIEVNAAARPVFGDIPDLIGRDYEDVLRIVWPEELADELVRIARHTLRTGATHHEPELSGLRADCGHTEFYDWRIDRIRLPDGSNGIVCYVRDVSEQVWARHALTESERRYRTLFESIDEGFCIVHVIFDDEERPIDYRFVEVNPAFVRHTGLTDAVGRSITELVPDIESTWIDAFGAVALTGEPTRFVEYAASMGRWFDDYVFRIGDAHERKVAVLFTDVTERKRAEHALHESVALHRYRAHHDALTGLPNRLLFEERLHEAVATADRHGRPFAVLFLDLDGFKAVNDELGHAGGDVVLVEIARRLRRSLRAGDVLARMHGDEFVIILPEMSETHEAAGVAEKLLAIVGESIEAADATVRVHASIGVGMYPHDGTNARALLRAADAAMYAAKLAGKNAVRFGVGSTDETESSSTPVPMVAAR